jgi:hypothetical protein
MALAALQSACGKSLVVAEQKETGETVDAGDADAARDGVAAAFDSGPQDDNGVLLCGTERCTGRTVSISGATVPWSPCCVLGKRSTCGLSEGPLGCTELNQPGKLDPECPDLPTVVGPLAGCCQPSGSCSGLDNIVGFGCAQFLPFLLLQGNHDCTY